MAFQCRSWKNCIGQALCESGGGLGSAGRRWPTKLRATRPVRISRSISVGPGMQHSHRVTRHVMANNSATSASDSNSHSPRSGRVPACIVSAGILTAVGLAPVWQSATQGLLLPMATGMASTAGVGFLAVPYLRRMKARQTVRSNGPMSHLKKAGTPTAGGAFLIPCGLISGIGFAGIRPEVMAAAIGTLAFSAIGAIDDMRKILGKDVAGLPGYMKAALQTLVAAVICLWASKSAPVLASTFGCSVPLWSGCSLVLGPAAYWALSIFTVVAESNGVNLTDGLDGLAGSTCAIAFAALALVLAPVAKPLAIMAAAMGGASAGFLVHNHYKAACFMGDTGSLALGGMVGILGALSSGFGPLLLLSGVFVAEAASVVLQVGVFKLTKRVFGEGRRVLRMSPLHHHLELCGWHELRVTNFLSTMAALLGAAAVFGPLRLATGS